MKKTMMRCWTNNVLGLLVVTICIPSVLFASVGIEESDFIQRTINFVIFVAIVWYFGADKIKNIFISRRNAISAQLQSVQEALQQSKKDEENAIRRLEECKDRAKDIINTARHEANAIEQRYNEQIKRDTQSLKHNLDGSIEFERRKMTQEAVNEVLGNLLNSDGVRLSKEDYVNIITKRIS